MLTATLGNNRRRISRRGFFFQSFVADVVSEVSSFTVQNRDRGRPGYVKVREEKPDRAAERPLGIGSVALGTTTISGTHAGVDHDQRKVPMLFKLAFRREIWFFLPFCWHFRIDFRMFLAVVSHSFNS